MTTKQNRKDAAEIVASAKSPRSITPVSRRIRKLRKLRLIISNLTGLLSINALATTERLRVSLKHFSWYRDASCR